MNLLYGVLSLDNKILDPFLLANLKGNEITSDRQDFLLGQQRIICNQSSSPHILKSSDIILGMIGEITNQEKLASAMNLDASNDLELVLSLYTDHGFSCMNRLEGLYTIAIYDGQEKHLYVFQDPFSSPLTLYWTKIDNTLVFSTSLKKLLLLSKIERRINNQALADFMVNGFIPNERTLIENIFKLIPGKYLKLKGEKLDVQSLPFKLNSRDKLSRDFQDNARKYYSVCKNSLKKLTSHCIDNDFNLILTAGYDSNFYVKIACTEFDKKINTYCIGTTDQGKHVGESSRAQRIAIHYDVDYLKDDLTESAIQDLPDIVWRTEGLCYDRGLFLRNKLGKLVSSRTNYVIGGDLANQIRNPFFYEKTKSLIFLVMKVYRSIRHHRRKKKHLLSFWNSYWKKQAFAWLLNPRQFGLFMNIKQTGLLMSTYNVQMKYLYVDMDYIHLINQLKKKFFRNQLIIKRKPALDRLHVEIVKSYLPPEVKKQTEMSKVPGINESFYFENISFRKKVAFFLSESDFLGSLIDKNLLNKVLNSFVESNSNAYSNLVTRLLYLELWCSIFLSGGHDDTFNRAEFAHSLNHFISKD
jgi:asparagine synthetase B (glutamine-hydrolysing)